LLLMDLHMIVVGDIKDTLSKISSIEELRIIKQDNYFDF